MIYWAQLLHFYQPPTQIHAILEKVCNESYRPLTRLIDEEPSARLTVNINGVLTEMLAQHGMEDVVSGLKNLAGKGKIEFTGSAKYHPVLPLLPPEEMRRQIELNYETNRHYFGESYAPKGFFPPEMCYGHNILFPVLSTGHEWLLLSGVACPAEWPTRTVYQVTEMKQKLSVLFRDDILSNKISFRKTDAPGFVTDLFSLGGRNGDIYVITAMDAETYGHHIKDWENLFLRRFLTMIRGQTGANDTGYPVNGGEMPEIRAVTVSELLRLFPKDKTIEPRPSSWSTSLSDIECGTPYPLWDAKDNVLHQLLWRHLWLTIELTEKAVLVAKSEDAARHAATARLLCDEAENSDQFWWASYKPVRNLSIIYRGLSLQTEAILNAYRAIKMSNLTERDRTECYYRVIAAADFRNKIIDALNMS